MFSLAGSSPVRMRSLLPSLPPFALVAVLAAAPLAAQGPSISARQPSGLHGTVFDSLLTGKPLVDAEVFLQGTQFVAHTDAKGQFKFDRLQAGKYTLSFAHPALDSLRLSAPSRAVDVPAGGTPMVALATPSLATLHQRACRGPMPDKAGLVLGIVKDADADTVVAGIEVVAEWSAIVLMRGAQPRQTQQVSSAVSDAAGRYVLCGVPTDVVVAIRAGAPGHRQGLMQLELGDRGIAFRDIAVSMTDIAAQARAPSLPAPQADSGAAAAPASTTGSLLRGTAQLAGTIRGEGGTLLAEAQVRVLGAATPPSKSKQDGTYSLVELPAGSQIVEVKALGYAPVRANVMLRRGRMEPLDIAMTKVAVVLDELEAKGYSTLFDRSGFEQRRQSGIGHYITEDEIRKRNPVRTEDVFRGVPGVQLELASEFGGYMPTFVRAQGSTVGTGGGVCYPNFVIDGTVYRGDTFSNTNGLPIAPQDVKGIELYASAAFAPPQFVSISSGCGVIVIWTKRGAPNDTFRKP